MKKSLIYCITIAVSAMTYAQVGIGNTDPEAVLDITASNSATPSATDGILIPRVDEMPASNPTAAQDGMLLFATGNGSIAKGFYYWENATTSWLLLDGAKSINQLMDGKSDVDGTNDGSSIFLGIDAGAVDDGTNNQNIGIGLQTLTANTSGNGNIALGARTLQANVTGFSNIGIGLESLYNNTGNGNIGIGFHTMYSKTSGNDNIAIGFDTQYNRTSGDANIAIGSQALRENASGGSNNAFGRYAISQNASGSGNNAFGFAALYNNLSGSGNVALGHYAGFNELGSNRLYIDNSATSNPLLYGEFDNNILRINGFPQVGNPAAAGYQLPSSDGSANQVLQTDGSGSVSWQDSVTYERAAFKVRQGANITSYNLYTYIPIIMTSLQYNYGGGSYNTSTGVYTVPHTGVYQVNITFSVNFNSTSVDNLMMFLRMYRNGSIAGQRTVQQEPSTSSSWGLNYSFNFQTNFNAGDAINFQYLLGISGTNTPRPVISSGGSTVSEINIARIY